MSPTRLAGVTLDVSALPAVTHAADRLLTQALEHLPQSSDGTDLDDTSRTEEVTLAGALTVTVTHVTESSARWDLVDLEDRTGLVGQGRWPVPGGWALSCAEAEAASALLEEWSALLEQIPYPEPVRAQLRQMHQDLRRAWELALPGPSITIEVPDVARIPGHRADQAALHRVGAQLASFAAANRLLHVLSGHGKSWEPGATLALRADLDGRIQLKLDVASYQLPPHLLASFATGERPVTAWPDLLEAFLDPVWRLTGSVAEQALDEGGDPGWLDPDLTSLLSGVAQHRALLEPAVLAWCADPHGPYWVTGIDGRVENSLLDVAARVPSRERRSCAVIRAHFGPQGAWTVGVDGADCLGLASVHPEDEFQTHTVNGYGIPDLLTTLRRAAALLPTVG